MVIDDPHRRPTLDLTPSRSALDATTAKRPGLIARMLAAEPRSKPAIVKRKRRRRRVMKLRPLTRPQLPVLPWRDEPSLVPLAFAALALVLLAALLALR